MISHKYKCIFIHITKCAGSSVEHAFGIDVGMENTDYESLFGWSQEKGVHLQHCTPQQLLDFGLIDENTWNKYYKFIIVRNPYERSLSDYRWIVKGRTIIDSFENFLRRKGKFESILTDNTNSAFRGDHLIKQKDYFYLEGKEIKYNLVIRKENIREGFASVIKDLKLDDSFFRKEINVKKANWHYSYFYNRKRKKIVDNLYGADLEFLEYRFEDERKLWGIGFSLLPSICFLPNGHWKKKIKKELKKVNVRIFSRI